jgi:hypothetical protein
MTVQSRSDIDNTPFILGGNPVQSESETVAQDAGRTADMVYGTLMSQNPSTKIWSSFVDETGINGTQIPMGVLLRTLPTADIVAGNVENVPILTGNAILNKDLLTIENSKTLDTVVNSPTNLNKRVEDLLKWLGIFMADVIDTTGFEN